MEKRPDKKNKSYFWDMDQQEKYGINLRNLSIIESIAFPNSFKEYSQLVALVLRTIGNKYILENDILDALNGNPDVENEWARGIHGMGAVEHVFPNRYIRDTIYPKKGGTGDEGVWGWFDLWADYFIDPKDELYHIFFVYRLRQADILELDDLLNYHLNHYYSENKKGFLRFITLSLRKHEELFQPEQIDTINEWIEEAEKQPVLSGTEDKAKVPVRRERDDKLTALNQEQTALLIYCLRKTKVILPDEFLKNKEAGRAFSILTGYSPDTIRQNLSKTEVAKTANVKNIEAVEKALKQVVAFIEKEIKPE